MRVCTAPSRWNRIGSLAVEAGLLLPVFVVATLGFVEFARGLTVGQAVTDAAARGARAAVQPDATPEAVAAGVKSLLHDSLGVAADDVRVSVTDQPSDRTCRVQVSVPYHKVGGLAGQFLASASVRGECRLRRE